MKEDIIIDAGEDEEEQEFISEKMLRELTEKYLDIVDIVISETGEKPWLLEYGPEGKRLLPYYVVVDGEHVEEIEKHNLFENNEKCIKELEKHDFHYGDHSETCSYQTYTKQRALKFVKEAERILKKNNLTAPVYILQNHISCIACGELVELEDEDENYCEYCDEVVIFNQIDITKIWRSINEVIEG